MVTTAAESWSLLCQQEIETKLYLTLLSLFPWPTPEVRKEIIGLVWVFVSPEPQGTLLNQLLAYCYVQYHSPPVVVNYASCEHKNQTGLLHSIKLR